MSELISLLKYNFSLEFRNKTQVISLLLLAWIVCYILFKIHPSLESSEFGYLFWMFMTLLSINVCLRSESYNGQEIRLYLYTIVDPVLIYLSKVFFNSCYLFLIAVLFYLSFHINFTEQVPFEVNLIFVILIGAFAISSSLTFVSTVSTYANGQNTLVSILAIPLLLPIIMLLKGLSDEVILSESIEYLKYWTILGLASISIAASLLLVPHIWKE